MIALCEMDNTDRCKQCGLPAEQLRTIDRIGNDVCRSGFRFYCPASTVAERAAFSEKQFWIGVRADMAAQ